MTEHQFSNHRFDVAIIGAGISGACASIRLAKNGARVLLLEAGDFPRHKVCGEFLSPESKSIFARLAVLETLKNAGAIPVNSARVVSRSGREVKLDLPQSALAISRFELDRILASAAQNAGAKVLCRTRVRAVRPEMDGFEIFTARGNFQARIILNAAGRNTNWLPREDGSTPPPASGQTKYVGLKTHFKSSNFPAGLVELHAWRGGYCGLVQVEGGVLNACLLTRYDILKGRAPEEFWSDLLHHLPALRARLQGAQIQMPWLATGNVVFSGSTPVAGKLWNCGDAAGFIHPLAGDGMAMAARSGELAGAILSSHLREDISEKQAREIYQLAWQREFASRLKWAARFQKCLIDSQLVAPALAVLSRVSVLGKFAVRATRG